MSVLAITGANGYLGGRLAQEWAGTAGLELRLAQRGAAPAPGVLPLDLDSDASLDTLCADADCVLHLAACNEAASTANPSLALEITAGGTLRLLQAAVRRRVPRFIFISTAHVYGRFSGLLAETTLPRPRTAYAITHRTAEDFVLAAHDAGLITGLVVRLSNGVGPPAPGNDSCWHLLANDLCRQAVKTGRLALKSSGTQLRDFAPLTDVARALDHLRRLDAAACGDGLFNLGGDSAISVVDLASLIAEHCARTLSFRPPISRPQPRPDESAPPWSYSIEKLKATNYRPQASLADEIDATLRFCRNAFCAASR